MPGYKPHLRFIAINPPQLHESGSALRLYDDPGLNFFTGGLVTDACLNCVLAVVWVCVLYFFIAVPSLDLWSVIVTFPSHTHLLLDEEISNHLSHLLVL